VLTDVLTGVLADVLALEGGNSWLSEY